MYFTEEPEHIRLLQETLVRFVEAELPAELRRRLDREHRFPPELFRKLADIGVCGLTVAEEFGGQGRDLVAAVEIALICQRVLGAYGLAEGHDMERHVRDLLGMPIVGGSSAMQKNNIANRLGLANEDGS